MDQITFVTLQGNTMHSDIRKIQDILRNNYPDCRFALIAQNVDITDKNKIKRIKTKSKRLLKEAECIFSMDGTLPLSDWNNGYKAQKRILFLEPFDYLYEKMYNKRFFNKLIKGFTDVIVPGEELTNFINSNCNITGINVHGDVQIPYIADLQNEEYVEQKRAILDEKFPWCKGKKLIVFMTSRLRAGQDLLLENVDLKSIIANLPNDTIFVTNNETFFRASEQLEQNEKERFVFVRRSLRRNDLATLADCLITDDSYLWSCHNSAKRNVFYFPYRKNHFLKYAKKNLKGNIITNLPKQIHEVLGCEKKNMGIDMSGSVPLDEVLRNIF